MEPTSQSLHGLDPRDLLRRGLEPNPTAPGLWEPPSPEEMARFLPHYRIERLLGRGGMGAVYKGFQPNIEREVAIKVLPAEVAENGNLFARFQREARILASLRHPGIVAIHDFGRTDGGLYYFVMEYIDGADLRELMQGQGVAAGCALDLMSEICGALQCAHAAGVVHRDIKPANILITRDRHTKLADFGIARPAPGADLSLTATRLAVGSGPYIAPEQRAGECDHRADIFALGVTLYEMLTGRPPRGAFQLPSRKVEVDARIDAVVLKALQANPVRRYQSVSEFKADLDHIRRGSEVPLARPAVKTKKARMRVAPAVGAVAAILLLGCAAWVFLARDWRSGQEAKKLSSPNQNDRPAEPLPAPPVLVPAVPVLVPAVPAAAPAKFEVDPALAPPPGVELSLFNGHDLSGWSGLPGYWSVEDGAIVGRTSKAMAANRNSTYLIWKGGEIGDFELRCEFKLLTGEGGTDSDSGIEFRTKLLDAADFRTGGYQANMNRSHTITGDLWDSGRRWVNLAVRGQVVDVQDGTDAAKAAITQTGSLGDHEALRSGMIQDEWNEYRIIAVGRHLQLFVNGRQTADITDHAAEAPASGLLGLELRRGFPMEVQFKDIKLRNLAGQPSPIVSPEAPAPASPGSQGSAAGG